MGKLTVEEVVQLLKGAGFRCQRSCPGKRMPMLYHPAVAVAVEQEDGDSVTMAISVLSRTSGGAQVCEDTALQLARTLRGLGAVCITGPCNYDGRADQFLTRVLATWREAPSPPAYTLWINGTQLEHTSGFTAVYRPATEPVDPDQPPIPEYSFTIEEQFPRNSWVPDTVTEPFTCTVRRGTVQEVYTGCRWTSISREDRDAQMRQIRRGTAEKQTIRT